jgi:hypothetical protein
MSGQGSYRPPPGRAGSERVSLEALEAAFAGARRNPADGNGPDDADARARQPAASSAQPRTSHPDPPWPTVIATTARLWLQRHWQAPGRPFRRRRAIAAAGLVVLAVVAGALAVALPRRASPRQPSPAPERTATAGHAAAVWVASQVSLGAIVGCDPGMCRLLQAQGWPGADLLVLRQGAAGLRSCDVVVATQAVRNIVGGRLQQQTAPAVVAGFGSGQARIEVRVVARGGAAAYQTALTADRSARRMAAAELANSPRIHTAGAARQELLTGEVDSRLLITLAELAVAHPVNVVAFGDAAPGASAGVPLREMEVSGTGSPAARSAELVRIRSLVLAQHSVFLPAHVSLVRLAGGTALRIEFGAPSPLGLLAGRPVTQ